jgi:hypothetical protein
MNHVFWILVRKDIYILRRFIVAAVLAGVLAVALRGFGKVGLAVGMVLFITVNVASGIFIAMYSLMVERRDRSRTFALSLPISGPLYDVAKLLSGYIAYCVPWCVLTVMAVIMLLFPSNTRGMVVYTIVLQGFELALFSVVLAALFAVTSEAMSGVVILAVNICFSLFMITLNQESNLAPLRGDQIVWTPFHVWVGLGEVITIALSVAFAMFVTSRRRDYI